MTPLTEDQIIKGNISCSEFIGPSQPWNDSKLGPIRLYHSLHGSACCHVSELIFHCSIKWLWAAWIKLRDTKLDNHHKVELNEIICEAGHSIAFETIPEAFLKIVTGIEFLNKVNQPKK